MPSPAETMRPLPVRLDAHGAILNGDLSIPADARGLVVFAHGSGSSRHSRRNRAVADVLVHAKLATLLLDLLTREEEETDVVTAALRFDMPLLADRVIAAIEWAQAHPHTAPLPIGLFGASTGAAAALIAASRSPAARAVVSRGGRPDLAEAALDLVTAPTLLVVGGRDDVVIELNERAFARLKEPKQLKIVAGATHLFEEPGALEQVSRLATDWFVKYLA
jgi:putative phosphoribosyl transferase